MGDTFPDGRWSWRPPITGQQTVANNLSGAKPAPRRAAGSQPARIAIRDSSDRWRNELGGIRGTLSHPNLDSVFVFYLATPILPERGRCHPGEYTSSRFAIRASRRYQIPVRTVLAHKVCPRTFLSARRIPDR